MKRSLWQDLVGFFKGHWPHLVLAIPMVVGFSVFHELAHCLAVWMQGGTVLEFTWLPDGDDWGRVEYIFSTGVDFNQAAVSLAPYGLWLLLVLVTWLLSLKRKAWSFWMASILFVWLYIAPVADIANAAISYVLWGTSNDLRDAFGPPDLPLKGGLAVLGVLLACLGFSIQKRLYRNRAMGMTAYCVLAMFGLFSMLLITSL